MGIFHFANLTAELIDLLLPEGRLVSVVKADGERRHAAEGSEDFTPIARVDTQRTAAVISQLNFGQPGR